MSNLPTTFAERVRERITEQIADLIPPEELTNLIEIRIADFKHRELPKLIDDEIRTMLSSAIKSQFTKPEYQAQWDGYGSQGASEMTLHMIEANAPRVLSAMIGSAVQQAMYSITNGRSF